LIREGSKGSGLGSFPTIRQCGSRWRARAG
jgi:hypothetical protein